MPLALQTRLLRVLEELEVTPQLCGEGLDTDRAAGTAANISLESAERQALLQVIEQNHWNMTLAAAHFKIGRNTLYRKIKRHGIPIAHRSDGI